MGQVHILTGVERRRRWSAEEKRSIVAEAFAPGAVIADVARRADVHCGQIYRWRKELETSALGFSPVVVSPGVPAVTVAAVPVIEVAARDGAQVRIPVSVSPELATAVIKAVVGR
jgi:transposase